MKLLISTLALAGSLAMAPAVDAGNAALEAPIHQFIDAFDQGDLTTAAAAYDTVGVIIIDEVAPHLWRGPGAFNTWAADLIADGKARGLSDERVDLGQFSREEVDDDRAYVIVPAVFHFKQRGVAMSEAAQMTYVLRKGKDDWKILAWTFTGPGPSPAGK